MIVAGVIPLSSAAEYTNGLKLEPGWRSACVARLNDCSRASNPPWIAITCPVCGFSATKPPETSGMLRSDQPPPSGATAMMSPGRSQPNAAPPPRRGSCAAKLGSVPVDPSKNPSRALVPALAITTAVRQSR
jgi:hypothetical protein